ncbi:monocarboxylate transporter 13 [Strongylocentrotus purpuratus]|uniref:Monocarboxylate transporter n=1 Tax=Strongylocentrotus purpuratus TaxID=7668 RepID=A0A7M7RI45_STRPU|nr:monocarboxylate transporter 13 [Strongylocentrotus purpuratus]|eukprot:XP_800666.3 PREDICTED: monocarboxylate transporter 13 [Strongylocentrotus purpuratus]
MEKDSNVSSSDGVQQRERVKTKDASQCLEGGDGTTRNTLAIQDTNPEAPDGGWGWMVVLGAFINGLVSAGFTSLISVLYVEWIQYFDVSAGELSWIGFLFPGTAGFVSIVIGKIWTVFGVRSTAVVGSILASAGCLGGSFSTHPYHIAISIGVVSGLGVGLCFISAVNMVAMYFHKRFGVANGIMFIGTSLSQIGVPPLTRFLVSQYGWRGTLQINSAIMCHSVAASFLLRPLKPPPKKKMTMKTASGECENKGFETREIIELDVLPHLSTPLGTPVIQRRRRINVDTDLGGVREKGSMRGKGTVMKADNLKVFGHQRTPSELEQRLEQSKPSSSGNDNCDHNKYSVRVVANIPKIRVEDWDKSIKASGKNRNKKDIPTDATKYLEAGNEGERKGQSGHLCKTLADMFGITLFRNEPLAILQNFSSMVVMIATFVPVAHVFVMATDRGMAISNAAALLSVLGVGGTVGRIISGITVDKQLIGPHSYMTLMNVLTAIPVAILPLVASNFPHAAATIFFTGIGIGSTIVIRIVQAKKVVSPAFMSDNVRFAVMNTGFGMTMGAVLSGWFADLTGSYSFSFYCAADILLFGAAINLTISVLSRRRRKKQSSRKEHPI